MIPSLPRGPFPQPVLQTNSFEAGAEVLARYTHGICFDGGVAVAQDQASFLHFATLQHSQKSECMSSSVWPDLTVAGEMKKQRRRKGAPTPRRYHCSGHFLNFDLTLSRFSTSSKDPGTGKTYRSQQTPMTEYGLIFSSSGKQLTVKGIQIPVSVVGTECNYRGKN